MLKSCKTVRLMRRVVLWMVVFASVLVAPGVARAQTPTSTVPPATTVPTAVSVATRALEVQDVDDGSATALRIKRIAASLIALSVLILGMTVWFWRQTKPMHRYLEGLSLMGTRRWGRADAVHRAALLEVLRSARGVPAVPTVVEADDVARVYFDHNESAATITGPIPIVGDETTPEILVEPSLVELSLLEQVDTLHNNV